MYQNQNQNHCIRFWFWYTHISPLPISSLALQLPDKTPPAHLTPPIKSIRTQTVCVLGNRARIPWNDCVSEHEAVLNNCCCIMSGAAHPPSPHCTSSKTSCWEGGGFTRWLPSAPWCVRSHRKERPDLIGYKKRPSGRCICKWGTSDCEPQSECHFVSGWEWKELVWHQFSLTSILTLLIMRAWGLDIRQRYSSVNFLKKPSDATESRGWFGKGSFTHKCHRKT